MLQTVVIWIGASGLDNISAVEPAICHKKYILLRSVSDSSIPQIHEMNKRSFMLICSFFEWRILSKDTSYSFLIPQSHDVLLVIPDSIIRSQWKIKPVYDCHFILYNLTLRFFVLFHLHHFSSRSSVR